MCRRRRLFDLVLLILLAVMGGSRRIPPVRAAAAKISIRSSADRIVKGDFFYVIITVSADEEISGFEGYFTYDQNVMKYVTGGSVSNGNDDEIHIRDIDRETGVSRIRYSVKFMARKPGTCVVSLKDPFSVSAVDGGGKMSVGSSSLNVEVISKKKAAQLDKEKKQGDNAAVRKRKEEVSTTERPSQNEISSLSDGDQSGETGDLPDEDQDVGTDGLSDDDGDGREDGPDPTFWNEDEDGKDQTVPNEMPGGHETVQPPSSEATWKTEITSDSAIFILILSLAVICLVLLLILIVRTWREGNEQDDGFPEGYQEDRERSAGREEAQWDDRPEGYQEDRERSAGWEEASWEDDAKEEGTAWEEEDLKSRQGSVEDPGEDPDGEESALDMESISFRMKEIDRRLEEKRQWLGK